MSSDEFYKREKKDIQEFNNSIIAEFRGNQGVVGGPFTNIPLLLLTTIGHKTGLERVNPLAYLHDGDRYIVIASFAGAPANPPWYYNLISEPKVVVEAGTERFTARATILEEPERTEMFAKMTALMPLFNEYQSKTSRIIPVIALTRETPAN